MRRSKHKHVRPSPQAPDTPDVADDSDPTVPGFVAPADPAPATAETLGLPSLAATIAGVIERQLGDYLTSVAARMEGFRNETAQHGLELRADLQHQLDVVVERLDLMEVRLAQIVADMQRIDTQSADLVHHVNEVTIDLAQQIDHGDQAVVRAVEERLGAVRTAIEAVAPGVRQVVDERLTVADQRLTTTDERLRRLDVAVDELRAEVGKVDEAALDGLREQLSSAVGEAMLVRIELDRAMADTAERLDKSNLRMAEIESMLGDELDVSAAVQLERLDEIERALAELDPDRSGAVARPSPTEPAPEGGPNDGYPIIGGFD